VTTALQLQAIAIFSSVPAGHAYPDEYRPRLNDHSFTGLSDRNGKWVSIPQS
jgi:hypothetical protein